MQTGVEIVPLFALLFGSGEILLILLLVLILVGIRRLPEIGSGLRQGLREFLRALRREWGGPDDEASEAGKSLGGIYGKPAAQALTPDNQTAELYDPAVFGEKQWRRRSTRHCGPAWFHRLWRRLWCLVCRPLGREEK